MFFFCRELSNLRNDTKNCTNCFSEVKRVRCVQGSYPEHLLRLWDLYDDTYGSENDSPKMFKGDQLYIVLEFANGGKDMESYQFKNSVQAEALFKQVQSTYKINLIQKFKNYFNLFCRLHVH